MSIVSRVTIIRGNGARAAGAPRDHESCEFRSDDVRRCGQQCLPTTRARAALPPGAPETVKIQRGGRAATSSSSSPRRASASAIRSSIPGSRTSATSSSARSTRTWWSSAASTPRPRPCSARASWPSGRRCSGQEAAQIGSARALRDDDFVFPSYRENGVAYCRGVEPDRPRPVPGGATASPAGTRTTSTWPRRRSSSARRPCMPPATRMGIQNDGADCGRRGLLRRRRHQRGRRQRGAWSSPRASRPRSSSSARTTSWAISEPVGRAGRTSRSPTGRPGFGIPEHARRRQRRPRRAWRRRASPSTAPARGGGPTFIEAVTYRMGPHTTADDPTRYRDAGRARGLGRPATRSRGSRRCCERKGLLDRGLRAEVAAAGRRRGRGAPRRDSSTMPEPQPLELFDHVYAEPHSGLDRQQEHYFALPEACLRRCPRTAAKKVRAMTQMTLAGAINAGLRRALEDDPKVRPDGRGHRRARRRLPCHRRAAGRLRRRTASWTPRSPSPASWAPPSAWHTAATVRSCEIQFDGFIYPAFDQIVSQVAKMHYRTQGAVKMPITIRVPFGGGIGSPSTTRNRPRPTSPTPRGCA